MLAYYRTQHPSLLLDEKIKIVCCEKRFSSLLMLGPVVIVVGIVIVVVGVSSLILGVGYSIGEN